MTEVPGFGEGIFYYYYSDKKWYSYGMFIFTILLVIYLILRDKRLLSVVKHEKYEITIQCAGEEISNKTKWLLWGVIASVGTLVIGEVISIIIRPAFTERYLYPVVSVVWIILAVGISELKNKKIVATVVIMITLFVCVPGYLTTYASEKAQNQKCEDTQKSIQSLLGKEDIILTNKTHLDWTILDYYFPETTHKQIANGYSDFIENENYWLFWADDLTEEDIVWLESKGYDANEELCEGTLGKNTVHVYRLTTKQ